MIRLLLFLFQDVVVNLRVLVGRTCWGSAAVSIRVPPWMAALFHYFHHHLLVAYRRGVKFFLPETLMVPHSLSRQVYLQFGTQIVNLLATATFALIFPATVFVSKHVTIVSINPGFGHHFLI
jgi:hypothetical protein